MSAQVLSRRLRNCLLNAKVNRSDSDLRREDLIQALYYRDLLRSAQA